MNGRKLETLVGMLVVLGAAIFLLFAYEHAGLKIGYEGYPINAAFSRVDGLQIGGEVKIGGIKIGQVIKETLDPNTYQAVVTMNIRPDVKIPSDSSAAIVSDGLLGGKYLNISPGADSELLGPNGAIRFTQSAVNLEDMIGQMIFSHDGSNAHKAAGH